MLHRTKMWRRRKFDGWRERVRAHLPQAVALYYSIPRNRSMEKRMGIIIRDLNDPVYPFQINGKLQREEDIIGLECALELLVEEFFAYIRYKSKTASGG